MSAGDFKAKDGLRLDPYLEQIADEMVKHADCKTVVLALGEDITEVSRHPAVFVPEVNGESKDRAEVLDDLRMTVTIVIGCY